MLFADVADFYENIVPYVVAVKKLYRIILRIIIVEISIMRRFGEIDLIIGR